MACDKKKLASIVALYNVKGWNAAALHLAKRNLPSCIHHATKNVKGLLRSYKCLSTCFPGANNGFNSPIAISEKKAPNQSIVKNQKSMPTTRPLLFHSSKGTGTYPMINSTAASPPTSVTGHDTPRRYGARIMKISNTSRPAKESASTTASKVVVQTRHFLVPINTVQPNDLATTRPALSRSLAFFLHPKDRPTPPLQTNMIPNKNLPAISQTLRPAHQTQRTETLWLDLNRDVEILHDRIHTKRHPTQRPQEHHGRW